MSATTVEHPALAHLWIHESPRVDLIENEMFRIFAAGQGGWLTDTNGERYFDLCSSMWQAPLGHGREDIVDAYAQQARAVAGAGPIFFTTQGAIELAERLAAVAPGDMSRCFLTSSGSEATESAIKTARQYHRMRGDHHRFKFISRYGAYHGAGVGGTSFSGRRHKDAFYYPLTPGAVHVMPPTGKNDIAAAEEIRTRIEMEGPDTVAAVIGEPVSITEFRIPDGDYWPRVREICDEYGVLLIVDETLTGCCRSGKMWAIEHWDVVPDLMIVAKSLSAGYAPISAMVVREHVYEAFGEQGGSPSVQSYGGHGASAAAGAKALQIYVDEGMPDVAEALGRSVLERVGHVRERAIVKDVRRLGSWIGIELCDPRTGVTLAQGLRGKYDVARRIVRLLLDNHCAAARMSEGILHISPPYVTTKEDIEFIGASVEAVLDELESFLSR